MEDIEEFWNHEFYKYEIKELEKYGLQAETVEFLSTVGLMNGKYFKEQSPMRFLSELEEETILNEKYLKIASQSTGSDGLYLKIGEEHLYYIEFPDEYYNFNKEFCNTRVYDYVKFETLKSMIASKYPKVADDELEGYQCAREVIEEFKKIDSEAVYPYSYWANRMLNYAIDYFYDEDEKFESAVKSGKYASRNDAYFDVLFNGMHVLEMNP